MVAILKKSSNSRGYILLESLIALGLLCLVTGSYILLNTHLLKKNKQATNQLQLHRILYEEMKRYENHGGPQIQEVQAENNSYQLHFYKSENKLAEVEIIGGDDKVTIKKE